MDTPVYLMYISSAACSTMRALVAGPFVVSAGTAFSGATPVKVGSDGISFARARLAPGYLALSSVRSAAGELGLPTLLERGASLFPVVRTGQGLLEAGLKFHLIG